MTDTPADRVVTELVGDIRNALEESLSIVKAAECCNLDGKVDRAVQILTDVEGYLHESRELFKAVITIKRNLLESG